MHTGSGRCSIFAMRTTSNYLPRLASAARRVQGPRSGTFRKLDTETWRRSLRVVAVLMWSTPFPPVYDSEMLPATIVVQLTKPTSSAPVGLNLVNGDEASSPPVLVEVRGLAAWSKCHLTSAELRSCA